MKAINSILLVLALLIVGFVVYKHFIEVVPPTNGDHGVFYVDGETDKELGVKLRNSSGSAMYGNGKRLEVLNETLNELKYIDPEGRNWVVPVGTLNDGASVPPLLESIIPGGLNTNARYAAIVHDFYCDAMNENAAKPEGGYPAIHKMFYHAMLCGNVEKKTAAAMYIAVVKFGPPHDRSLWARIVANGSRNDFIDARSDSNHPLAKWLEGVKVEQINGKTVIRGEKAVKAMEDEQMHLARLSEIEKKIVGLSRLKNAALNRIPMQPAGGINPGINEKIREIDEEVDRINRQTQELKVKKQEQKISAKKAKESLREIEAQEHQENQKARQELDALLGKIDGMTDEEITLENLDQTIKETKLR